MKNGKIMQIFLVDFFLQNPDSGSRIWNENSGPSLSGHSQTSGDHFPIGKSRFLQRNTKIFAPAALRNHLLLTNMARFIFWRQALLTTKVWTPNLDTFVRIQGAFCSTTFHFSDLNPCSTTCGLDLVGDVIISHHGDVISGISKLMTS